MAIELKERPLMLFCSPRGGSSLVAGVFARHGFWTGETFGGPDGKGSGGYVNYENAAIKDFMKKTFPLDAGNHALPPGEQYKAHRVREFCDKLVPSGTPWMFKGPSEYYIPLLIAFPHMVPVMVFRDTRQAVEAHVRRYGEKVREGAERIVAARYRFMHNVLMNRVDAYRVDADCVVQGDLAQVGQVLAQYGVTIDHRKAMEDISPNMFHR